MTTYTLALEFDINQITRSLQYHFSNPEETEGILAGTFNFNRSSDPENDTLQISLLATGDASGQPVVNVKDCTLVSVSNGDLGKTFLSPFNQFSAVSSFPQWKQLENMQAPAGRVKLFGMSGTKLPVIAPKGQWEISGYLSVEIIWNGQTYYRVFTFDPEGTAGAGTGMGWPDMN